jgi:phospholipid/cholesterol/gamma-HCH transport system permease protein
MESGARSGAERRPLAWLDTVLGLSVRPLRGAARTSRRLLAFALIVLATIVTKSTRARKVVRPLIWGQVRVAGVGLLPLIAALAVVLGMVGVGQMIVVLLQFGAGDLVGKLLVAGLFREMAPLTTALIVMLRVGTPTVVELAMQRAAGEVEALEALSIDPVHFLVVPRVIGLAVSVFCLTAYFLICSIASGYLFCFLRGVPLSVGEYLGQFARALVWQDFVFLVLKTLSLGATIAVITCYQGLARPLRLEQAPAATTRAVSHSLIACVALDAVFLAGYLLL